MALACSLRWLVVCARILSTAAGANSDRQPRITAIDPDSEVCVHVISRLLGVWDPLPGALLRCLAGPTKRHAACRRPLSLPPTAFSMHAVAPIHLRLVSGGSWSGRPLLRPQTLGVTPALVLLQSVGVYTESQVTRAC